MIVEDFEIKLRKSCTPFIKMISTRLVDAKQECRNSHLCAMFFDNCGAETEWYYCMNTGYEVGKNPNMQCGATGYTTLYKKGNKDVLNNVM